MDSKPKQHSKKLNEEKDKFPAPALSSTDSESDVEDSDAELITENIDTGIQQVLEALKSDSTKLKDPNFRFFPEISEEPSVKPKEKPVTLKDYQRERILESADPEKSIESFRKEEQVPVANNNTNTTNESESDLIKAFHESDDSEDELLSKRKEEREIPEINLPDPSKDQDGFLNAYLSNQAWKSADQNEKLPTYNEIVEEDDEEEKISDMFEQAYNFRYEDPEANEIVSYARDQNTLRRGKLSQRQRKRLAEQEAKQAIKEQEKLELAKLKKTKVSEVTNKLSQLQEALGEDEDKLAELLANEDLDKDWDDKDWDKRMQRLFDEEFYNKEDEETKLTKKDLKRKAEEFVESNEDLIKDQRLNNGGFRYREVDPENFGLTTKDILLASDKDLNKFAGLKKLAAYRDKDQLERDRKRLAKSKNLRKWRREVFGTEEVTDELWEKAKLEAENELKELEGRTKDKGKDKKRKSKRQGEKSSKRRVL